jgi:hypothetical protein
VAAYQRQQVGDELVPAEEAVAVHRLEPRQALVRRDRIVLVHQ